MEPTVIPSKNVVQSISGWGSLMLAVPILVTFAQQLFGVAFSEQDVVVLQQTPAVMDAAWKQIMLLIGTVQMVIGRVNARQPLHFLPGGQFLLDIKTGQKIRPLQTVPDDVAAEMKKADETARMGPKV